MIALYILIIVCCVVIMGGLSWYAMQDQDFRCNSNGCTGDCVDNTPEINPNWPFPTGPKR